MDGVGAARELERLCKDHRAYRWLCGGLAVNYHTLSDFRVEHGQALDELLTQTLAALMERKLIELKRVSQDGLRVRAGVPFGARRSSRTISRRRGPRSRQPRRSLGFLYWVDWVALVMVESTELSGAMKERRRRTRPPGAAQWRPLRILRSQSHNPIRQRRV